MHISSTRDYVGLMVRLLMECIAVEPLLPFSSAHTHRHNPHVVCIQEATAGFVAAIMKSEWVRKEYALSHGDVEGDEE